MRVLVTIIAPVYWSLAQASGAAQSGFLLAQGTFQHESLLSFATGEGSLPGEPAQLLGKLQLHLHHAPSPIWGWSCVLGCRELLLTVPLCQGSSCGSPTSPGARMALAL